MEISYHPRVLKFLHKITPKDAARIIQAIDKLQNLSAHANLDIKKLVTTERSYRLRVGNIRVIYEIESERETVYIQEIDFRGNVY